MSETRLTPEEFLDLFRWREGRNRQRADAWAAYMQDVLGPHHAQVCTLERLAAPAIDESAVQILRAADLCGLDEIDAAVQVWRAAGRPGLPRRS